MNKDHYPMYGIALVAGAAVAVWAGMPVVFLLVLACPLMMFFMMRSMGGTGGGEESGEERGTPVPPQEQPGRVPSEDAERP